MNAQPTPRVQALVEAATAVLAESGLRGLTHRAVDARAGLPEGSCSAYLRTRQALLQAVADAVFERVLAEVQELAARLARHPGDGGYAVGAATEMFLSWLRDPQRLRARLELELEADRSPELAERTLGARAALVSLVADLVPQLAGAPVADATDRAETLVAALDGVLLAALRKPARQRAGFVQSSLDRMLPLLAH